MDIFDLRLRLTLFDLFSSELATSVRHYRFQPRYLQTPPHSSLRRSRAPPALPRRGCVWQSDQSFLYFCAFEFGSVFHDVFTSCLMRTTMPTVNDASELRAAIGRGFISTMCARRLDYFSSRISNDANDPILRLLAKLRDNNGMHSAENERASMEFLLHGSRLHAAVLSVVVTSPARYFRNLFGRADICVSRGSVN